MEIIKCICFEFSIGWQVPSLCWIEFMYIYWEGQFWLNKNGPWLKSDKILIKSWEYGWPSGLGSLLLVAFRDSVCHTHIGCGCLLSFLILSWTSYALHKTQRALKGNLSRWGIITTTFITVKAMIRIVNIYIARVFVFDCLFNLCNWRQWNMAIFSAKVENYRTI